MTGALAADASAVRELLARRTEAGERFFGAEAERIARLCHGMAERFARGGRLLALGVSDQANPGVEHIEVSARTGEGVDGFKDWLAGVAAREAAPA